MGNVLVKHAPELVNVGAEGECIPHGLVASLVRRLGCMGMTGACVVMPPPESLMGAHFADWHVPGRANSLAWMGAHVSGRHACGQAAVVGCW